VVKLSLAGLGHKGAVGGVRLGLCTPDDVAEACRQIVSAVTERGLADADDVGFLVQEMEFGAELLVSAVRDPVAGPALIVGVGGWAAEAGTPFAVIPLPASEEEVARALTGGPLPRLLGGDGTALVPLLHRLGQQFLDDRLGEFSIVECNPVIVTRNGPRIADALLVKNSL
jgi:acetyltransferase